MKTLTDNDIKTLVRLMDAAASIIDKRTTVARERDISRQLTRFKRKKLAI